MWYASHHGSELSPCGTMHNPCSNIRHLIQRALPGDVIFLDGNLSTSLMYQICPDNFTIDQTTVKKPLHIIGLAGRPRIGCPSQSSHMNSSIDYVNDNNHPSNCMFIIHNWVIENAIITTSNCTIELANVTFTNSSLVATGMCTYTDIFITESTWLGRSYCDGQRHCINTHMNNLVCNRTILRMTKTELYQTTFLVQSPDVTEVFISEVLFSNKNTSAQFMGGLHLTFGDMNADIYIQNSVFSNQLHPSRVKSVTNLFEASIWLKSVGKRKYATATVVITNVTFSNNERGITIIGQFFSAEINNSTFTNNVAMHAGAALLVLVNESTTLLIADCIFSNNAAGKYRNNYEIEEEDSVFQLVGSEVRLSDECCKGVITLVGKGGAIRVQRGAVDILNSRFINNTARLLGGSVFVDMDGTLSVRNSYFENSVYHQHSLQGDVLYSDGAVVVNNVELIINKALNSLSVLRHSGDHWSLNITNVWMQCPIGYNLRITNSSAYGVSDIGLRRSYLLDQLSYFCESCPRNKYSMDFGYLNYTLKFNKFAYYTLLINGKEPVAQYTGNYMHHEIQCNDCPYGGHCVQDITAVANFWGYNQNSTVYFQHCPPGYCCSSPKCPSIHACATHRTGRLCGKCKNGYSEALFSPACVENEKCGPIWLYAFSVSLGFIYTLFLLFQTDLRGFLFGKPLRCGLISSCLEKVSESFHLKNRVHLRANRSQENIESKFMQNINNSTTSTNCKENNHFNSAGNMNETIITDDTIEPTDPCSGYLIILFYYFQDALLLHVQTVYVHAESKSERIVKTLLSGILKFDLDVFELVDEVCVVPDMTAAPKIATKALIVPYVLGSFIIMYIVYKLVRMFRGNKTCDTHCMISRTNQYHKTFATRLASGFILALLFTFQKLGTTIFMLLNCVSVEGENVLFYDGTVVCYELWQYAAMTYSILCVSPLFVVLIFGPRLLHKGLISLSQFFIACLCPLPFIIYWTGKGYLRRQLPKVKRPLPENVSAVLQILQGPFKENKHGVCWSGVLIGRRLVLVLLYTFVNDSLVRLLSMLLACFIILLHHVHVQPYKNTKGNIAGTVSAAGLVTLGSLNLVRAGFEAAEYTPTGPNAFLMNVFDEIENTLLLWFPLGVMSLVSILFIIRTKFLLIHYLHPSKTAHNHNSIATENNHQPSAGHEPSEHAQL